MGLPQFPQWLRTHRSGRQKEDVQGVCGGGRGLGHIFISQTRLSGTCSLLVGTPCFCRLQSLSPFLGERGADLQMPGSLSWKTRFQGKDCFCKPCSCLPGPASGGQVGGATVRRLAGHSAQRKSSRGLCRDGMEGARTQFLAVVFFFRFFYFLDGFRRNSVFT